MDVVEFKKVLGHFFVNGWILKMTFNLKLPNDLIKKSKLNHRLVDFQWQHGFAIVVK